MGIDDEGNEDVKMEELERMREGRGQVWGKINEMKV